MDLVEITVLAIRHMIEGMLSHAAFYRNEKRMSRQQIVSALKCERTVKISEAMVDALLALMVAAEEVECYGDMYAATHPCRMSAEYYMWSAK